jgi:hypothetical protein
MEIKPFYFSEIHKQYEIEYLESNNYKFIKDLSYIKNNYESRILLFEYDNKNILRGYKDGIIFPKITYFDIENIHIKKKEKKLQEVFDYIYNIFSEYNIINTKIYQDPYLCFELGYSLFDIIDIKNFSANYELNQYINYDKSINLDSIEKEMEGGGTRTIINGYKKNKIDIQIYYGFIDDDIFNNFKNKHIELAGKQTRSDKCWKLNKDMIINKEAILVCYENNFVLFHCSPEYSYYGINACTKKDKIVSILLYEGIQWLLKNNFRFIHFDTFYIHYKDEKMINISKFKKSFCNKIFNQYYLAK